VADDEDILRPDGVPDDLHLLRRLIPGPCNTMFRTSIFFDFYRTTPCTTVFTRRRAVVPILRGHVNLEKLQCTADLLLSGGDTFTVCYACIHTYCCQIVVRLVPVASIHCAPKMFDW
jgi:hypothetical protein